MSCEYCDKNNTPRDLRGEDGIVQENGECYIYIEHFRNEVLTIDDVKYCPMCGRKL